MNWYRLILASSQNKCLLQWKKELNENQDVHMDPMCPVECNKINNIIKYCSLLHKFLMEAKQYIHLWNRLHQAFPVVEKFSCATGKRTPIPEGLTWSNKEKESQGRLQTWTENGRYLLEKVLFDKYIWIYCKVRYCHL